MKSFLYKNDKIFIPDRYDIPLIRERINSGVYEKEELTLLNKYLDKKDYVLEIGGCLGITTLELSRKCKHVICVEANPELKESLRETMKKNNVTNADLIFKYISETLDTVTFQTYDFIVAGSADRQDNAREFSKTRIDYSVECIKAKEIPNISQVNCLNIDCEGGELIFLEENSQLIRRCNKMIVETHQFLTEDKKFNQKCLSLINNYGFVLVQSIGSTHFFKKEYS